MSFKETFRKELEFIKKDGNLFSEFHPHLSRFLSDKCADPDAERIIESFAFLTAKVKEKLDDSFPELTHSILHLLWPNYLRPVPSCSILQFIPKGRAITTKHVIPKGTKVDSKPVNDTKCHFRSCTDVAVYPLNLKSAEAQIVGQGTILKWEMECLSEQGIGGLDCDELSIFFAGSDYNALSLLQWFFNYLNKITLIVGDKEYSLPLNSIEKQGFDNKEALLPYPKNVFDGYRLIQEFFHFPKRFYFVKLVDLKRYFMESDTTEFNIIFQFSRSLPGDIYLTKDDFKLYCTPIINLFDHVALPINFDGEHTSYPVVPVGRDKDHFEVFSIESVTGVELNSDSENKGILKQYTEFETFSHDLENQDSRHNLFYKKQMVENIQETGFDYFLSFVKSDQSLYHNHDETISVDLVCSNRNLPEELSVGDIKYPSQDTPSYVDFINITKPVASINPVIDGTLQWNLISNLSLNYLSLMNTERLKNLLMSYDFLSFYDVQAKRRTQKRIDAIKKINSEPVDKLIKGIPFRGIHSTIEIDGSGFLCEGEVYLFGNILAEFLRLYSTINSFHELTVVNLENNETFIWTLEIGRQPVI
ncbi:type VI secretion system baseplate subunit TssF [Pasteurella atlantica]|uniref:Type VI secretion system baseplate subunit TssF n=2 Tax=Pasteurellaceae TaxID=712 RepID=A0ACC6HPA2_9PAST|nr:type VI secretion system baseplate subunit TssF [Pasteurella atlantica]MDP8052623.1 type VI secretion system baseplate subunit TssF [Pasteurella atlantica]MDP8105777.1 type VI secretion system baseplate subunit TssF [Pasteurella atlantica]MDP8149281.1 type VI secretion system baseplate subunit TssF [Pasteurella atlantica]